MQNDPKWRTIARLSQQRIGDVISVFLHVLDNASNATERGRTENLNPEDIASALDLETLQVDAILAAMQGRVMEGPAVSAWEKRQPAREDGSAERSKAWREEQKAKKEREQTPANATDHTANAAERTRTPREEKSREDKSPIGDKARKRAAPPPPRPDDVAEQAWNDWTDLRAKKRAPVTQTVLDEARRECAKAGLSLERFLQVWCMRGSQGLQADWLRPDERGPGPGAAPAETAYQRSMRERVQEAAPSIARRAPAAAHQDATDFFRTVDTTARVVPHTQPAIEVLP
ncbi:hypothetical protein [Acidovorax sp. Root219]|uniref:hypothetical protein n=1 Tax=Acidovorax sp. Root219 TaxID=1736493 RepID=UPI000713038C|nr:hypothetical protein [Acidovorax sp. Root219]KRC36256.1 hypothetical protein ASE28_01605 [Acidovorax sp. Root219]